MNNACFAYAALVASSLQFAGCGTSPDPFEVRRAEMIAKTGNCIWNTGGCDMLYYPTNAPITEESFVSRRLAKSHGTKVTAISYCPLSSGFGLFTARKAGDFMDRVFESGKSRNAARDFAEKLDTDALEMACRFARKEGKNVFVSIRMNDTHDSSHSKKHPSPLFSPFKERHPECLVGEMEGPNRRGVMTWSSVDYSHSEVREALKGYIRQFCENYDIDGVELDFNRHAMFFRSTFKGGVASEAEIAIMTQLMREIRALTERLGRIRGKPFLLLARTDDSIAHDRAVGYDPTQWMAEGLIDYWIAGGYTRIDDYDEVVAVARRYPKVKLFASMDESRVDGSCGSSKKPYIHGRWFWTDLGDCAVPFYAACISAAMSAGFDGIWHFNIEESPMPRVVSIDPADTECVDKRYYATERDPRDLNWHLKDGLRFLKTPDIDPTHPRRMAAGETYSFSMIVGDDFAAAAKRGKVPTCGIRLLATGSDKVTVRMNDDLLKLGAKDGDILKFPVRQDCVRRGRNRFEITADAGLTLHDFVLDIVYSDGQGNGEQGEGR